MPRIGRYARGLATASVALLVAACGASASTVNDNGARPRTTEHEGASSSGRTSGEGPVGTSLGGRAAGACPARFGALEPSCTDDDVPVGCAYPEGSCACEQGTWCGGAAPPPMPLTWRCRPRASPCAPEGSPCTEPGASCRLDDCGFHGLSCTGGVWRSYMTPPPP